MIMLRFLTICAVLSFNSNVVVASSNRVVSETGKGAKPGTVVQDTLKKLEFVCKTLRVAENQGKFDDLKQTIAKNESFLLVYKSGEEWLMETDKDKSISIINASKSNKIFYLEGNISILGILYPKVKYAVILQ